MTRSNDDAAEALQGITAPSGQPSTLDLALLSVDVISAQAALECLNTKGLSFAHQREIERGRIAIARARRSLEHALRGRAG